MTIDINALRKFQDVWAPVLEAIPAVMDMAAKQADIERGMVIAAKDLEKAKAEIQKAYDEADKRLVALNADMDAAIAARTAALADIADAKKKASEAAKTAEQKALNKLAEVEAKIKERTMDLATLSEEYAAKRNSAEEALKGLIAEQEAKLKDVEKRYAAAEKALEALRAKLG